MLNNVCSTLEQYRMVRPGDTLICGVSGGADSMALLWSMYLLREKLDIRLEAAHFNHRLRGAESDRDGEFVRQFCRDYAIPLHMGSGQVVPGPKGLENAAREARYGFFRTLTGKIATAHTADDNAETVLMHLIRGTGLKGLGAIAPVSGNVIRPMLNVTRTQVLEFLRAYHIPFVEDSSNGSDEFLRNRVRHSVMPLLKQENPRFSQNVSACAQRLRLDEQALESLCPETDQVEQLRQLPEALRSRAVANLLRKLGVREPEAEHIRLADGLIFSPNPSAAADLPGGVRLQRCYGRLQAAEPEQTVVPTPVACPGVTRYGDLCISCTRTDRPGAFTVRPVGCVILRSRQPGDAMRLPGGTKSLKKLFIDRKIPAAQRQSIPVLADDAGVLGVYGIGPNRDRLTDTGIEIKIEACSGLQTEGGTENGQ